MPPKRRAAAVDGDEVDGEEGSGEMARMRVAAAIYQEDSALEPEVVVEVVEREEDKMFVERERKNKVKGEEDKEETKRGEDKEMVERKDSKVVKSKDMKLVVEENSKKVVIGEESKKVERDDKKMVKSEEDTRVVEREKSKEVKNVVKKSGAKKEKNSTNPKVKEDEMSSVKEKKSGNKGTAGMSGKVKEGEVAAPLDQVPGETIEKIFLQLDSVSAVHFGLCSTRLRDLLSEPGTFRRFLDNIQFDVCDWNREEHRMKPNKELVSKIVSVILTTSDPRPLLAGLQDTIAAQFFAKVGSVETVGLDRPGLQPLHVDSGGVMLLLHAREGLLLSRVKLSDGSWLLGGGPGLTGALLTGLSSLASGRRVELEVFDIKCSTEEEGLAMNHLLDCCMSWKVRDLRLTGEVGLGIWEGLAEAADRGTLDSVHVDRNILKKGSMEDVRKVWDGVKSGIGLGGLDKEMVWKSDGKWGWGRINWLRMNV